jgi:hypothetical protein
LKEEKKGQIEGVILCFKRRNKESKMWHQRGFILIQLIIFFFKTMSHDVTQAGLKLVIILKQPPEC